MASTETKRPHVVIVGAGYGGSQLARDLLKEGWTFTIIDRQEFMHHCVASVRAVVSAGQCSKLIIRNSTRILLWSIIFSPDV